MPDETLITEIENLLSELVRLGGENERTSIVPNLTVVNAAPTNLAGWIIVSDDRDGDNILAKKVPGVIYNNNDLVNVMFLKGGEAIAFQQGSGSASSGLWSIVTGTSTDIYYTAGNVGVGTATPAHPLDISGITLSDASINADAHGFVVKNTSGSAAAANEVGYIDDAGEYKTTTTQFNDVAWCVVLIGAANGSDIYVARRGRVTIELDGNCSAGDYLYTGTTAGQANPQSYTRPELFAIALTANAGGAGGTCEALLLTQTKAQPVAYAENLFAPGTVSDSDFNGTIATLPGGAVLTYTPVSGDELNLDPTTTTAIAKLRLYNSTRATYGLINDTDTATNTITLTAAVDAGWQVGDSITLRSQTNTSVLAGPSYWFDLEIEDTAEIPILARSAAGQMAWGDTGAAGETLRTHPWETSSGAKRRVSNVQVAGQFLYTRFFVTFIQRRFCVQWTASGAGTGSMFFRPDTIYLASP